MARALRPGSRWWWLSCTLWVAQIFAAAPALAQVDGSFAEATAAFEAGDYLRAVSLFQAARANGLDSPALHYNLGVSQYRVGDYAEAEATFDVVRARFPDLGALADYNRGLALLALDRDAEARAAFERARREGDDPLRELASRALALTAPAAPPRTAWVGYFDAGLGDDDNVALVDELSLPATLSAASSFTELAGYAGRRIGGTPLRFGISGYLVRYADAPQYDQDALRVDLGFEWARGDWRIEAGPYFGETLLDGDGFERTLGVGMRALRPLAEKWSIDFRFSHDDLEATSSRFDFVAGTRDRLRVGLDLRGAAGRLRPSLELERNDRASASVSPDRQRLALRYGRSITELWSLDATIAYRNSDFDDLAAPRQERLREASATARRALARGFTLSAQYRWADNESNVAQFSYTSNRVSLALGKVF
jgi:tetratricopeptide (TPR) repeat protein